MTAKELLDNFSIRKGILENNVKELESKENLSEEEKNLLERRKNKIKLYEEAIQTVIKTGKYE
jgi:hypothetical protein